MKPEYNWDEAPECFAIKKILFSQLPRKYNCCLYVVVVDIDYLNLALVNVLSILGEVKSINVVLVILLHPLSVSFLSAIFESRTHPGNFFLPGVKFSGLNVEMIHALLQMLYDLHQMFAKLYTVCQFQGVQFRPCSAWFYTGCDFTNNLHTVYDLIQSVWPINADDAI